MNVAFSIGSASPGYRSSNVMGIVMVRSFIFIFLSAVCLAATLSLTVNASLSHRQDSSSFVTKPCENFLVSCYLPVRG